MELNEKYKRLCDKHSPPSKTAYHLLGAFCVGALISFIGQWLCFFYTRLGVEEKEAYLLVTLSFITLAALFTALGFFDRIASFAGAGTLVPVTGFSNAVTSSAIDTGAEGYKRGGYEDIHRGGSCHTLRRACGCNVRFCLLFIPFISLKT